MKKKLELINRCCARSGFTRIACITLLAVATLTLCGCPVVVTPPPTDTTPPGSAVAPGLNITVSSVTIPLDLKPVVKFTATDNKGNIIPLKEITDARFILAYLETPKTGSTARLLSYTTTTEDPDHTPNSGDEATQASYDTARLTGLTQANDGVFTYKFAKAIPSTYSKSATHQLGGQFSRSDVVDGKSYPFNLIYDFRPDGVSAPLPTREIVDTETCNVCHTRLGVHGGNRREVQLCIMCHNTQSSDANTGNSVDFPVMIHKIHMGKDLPSVLAGDPYQIIGFGNSVNDYSTVAFPQDIRNCTACHTHAPQAGVNLTKPTLAGCASCHDRTWFGSPDQMPAGYTVHVGGIHTDDSLCTLCHTAHAPGSAPIDESHLLPTDSDAAIGLALQVTNITTTPPASKAAAGTTLKVAFTAKDKHGNPITDPTTLSSFSINCAWPTTEYTTTKREALIGTVPGTLVNNHDGTYEYTFKATLPASSADTFAVAFEGRRNFTFRGATVQQGPSENGLTYFTLDGSDPVPRRHVVDDAKCNACHKDLHLHGENRVGVDYCVMCHFPSATDIARRPAGSMPPESIHFKTMIHKIHSGENLTQAFTIYGFGGSKNDFTDVRFPGDRTQCTICHTSASVVNVPVPDVSLPTVVAEGATIDSTIQPTRAACMSCHDDVAANVHALLQTDSNGVESCVICHETTADFAVAKVHAQTP